MRKLRAALVTAVTPILNAQGFPNTRIVGENMPRPRETGNWVSLWFKPNNPTVFSLGPGGTDLVTGTFLVNIHERLDSGTSKGLSATSAIRVALQAGTRLIFEGQELTITDVGANLGRIVDAWGRSDISLNWRAFLTRGVT